MEDLGKLTVAKGLKKLPKVKKSPNLVTRSRLNQLITLLAVILGVFISQPIFFFTECYEKGSSDNDHYLGRILRFFSLKGSFDQIFFFFRSVTTCFHLQQSIPIYFSLLVSSNHSVYSDMAISHRFIKPLVCVVNFSEKMKRL